MNKEFPTKNGVEYERITKTQARKMYDLGQKVYICPSKARVNSPWIVLFELCEFGWAMGDTFQRALDRYEIFNCNSELGWTCKYFKKA
jgi:hypothetical protein